MQMMTRKIKSPDAITDIGASRLMRLLSFSIIAAFAALPLLLKHNFNILPAEDAAILYNYSENLAATGIISYSPNGPIEEGATDFLWMITLSVLHIFGLDVFDSALILNGLGATAFVTVLMILSRKYNPLYASFFCLLCVTAEGFISSIVGFATNFFYGVIAIAFLAMHLNKAQWFIFFCTVAALTRPEGIFTSSFLLGFHWLFLSNNKKDTLIKASAGFVLPVSIYWLWRTWYFDNILPLPLQIKVGSDSSFSALYEELKLYVLVIFSLLCVALYQKDKPVRETACLCGAFALFFVMYGHSLLSQNVYNRFLFFAPFLTLLSLANNVGNSSSKLIKKLSLIGLFGVLAVQLYNKQYIWNFSDAVNESRDTASSIGRALKEKSIHGVALVTEAGRFTYFSKWTAVDSWGLNSKKFTRNLIRPGDIETEKYDIVFLHPSATQGDRIAHDGPLHACLNWYVNGHSLNQKYVKTWDAMIENILIGIKNENYNLYLVPYLESNQPFARGRNSRFDCYFLNKSSSNFYQIEEVLRDHNAIRPDVILDVLGSQKHESERHG